MTFLTISIGRAVLSAVANAGRGTILFGDILVQLPAAWKMRREILEQMNVVGIGSLPLVITTSFFVGAVTAVQAVYQMQAYVPMVFLGTAISKSVFIELGPVLTALVVGGRLCANYAAELGTMKVTEQLDAMEMIAIDPVRYLAMPRFVAAVVMLPVITVFADAIAILSGYFFAVVTMDVTSSTFIEGLKMFYKASDLMGGLTEYQFPEVVSPGEEVDVTVLLKAPSSNGNFSSYWKLQSEWGGQFGVGQYDQPFYVQVNVNDASNPNYTVTNVTYNVVRDPAVGCATNVWYRVNATITTNGPATVKYQWLQSDGNCAGGITNWGNEQQQLGEYRQHIANIPVKYIEG